MKKILLVDGNSLLHRAYHAYPSLTTSKGEVVGAVYGFTSLLFSAIEKQAPTHMAIAWDVGKATFRHEFYEDYKAGRPEMDEELANQIERTKQMMELLNIPQYGVAGFEADDLIGTLVNKACDDKDCRVIIMTGDRDALQLVEGESVVVYMPVTNHGIAVYGEEAVEAKYQLSPKQIIDLKGLMGDASDNIKGVAGIGQVTATKLLQMQKSTEDIYEHLDELKVSERIKQLLREGKDDAFLSKKLATINKEVPIEFNWEACRLADCDRTKVVVLMEELEFKSLIDRLPADKWEMDLEEVFS